MLSGVDVSVLLFLCTAQQTTVVPLPLLFNSSERRRRGGGVSEQLPLRPRHQHHRPHVFTAAGQFYISFCQKRPLLFSPARCSYSDVFFCHSVRTDSTVQKSLTSEHQRTVRLGLPGCVSVIRLNQKLPPAASVRSAALGIPAEGFYSQDSEADRQPADPGIPPPASRSLISAANFSEREECVFVYGASVSPHRRPLPHPPP